MTIVDWEKKDRISQTRRAKERVARMIEGCGRRSER